MSCHSCVKLIRCDNACINVNCVQHMYVVELLRTMQDHCWRLAIANFRDHAGILSQRDMYCTSIDKMVWTSPSVELQPIIQHKIPCTVHGRLIVMVVTELLPKTSNEYGDQQTSVNRQAVAADWDTHYKRQQSTSWLDSRLQEHREWKVQHWS